MSTGNISTSDGSFVIVNILTLFAGLITIGFGLLIVPQSVLGGFHIVAIGLSLLLSGLIATEWVGNHFGLATPDRRRLALAFAVFAVILLVTFVGLNYASFQTFESTEIGRSV